jgi:hypothetical protein
MTSTLTINKKTMTMFAMVVAAATCLGTAIVTAILSQPIVQEASGYAKGFPNPNSHASNDGTANAFFHTKSNQPCSVYCDND